MKPIDIRDHNWATLRAALTTCQSRAAVFAAIAHCEPCTTREVALRMGREVHTIRPRFTELEQHGLIYIADHITNDQGIREGIYRVRTPEQFAAWRETQLQPTSGQIQMPLNPLPSPLSPLTPTHD
jgi:predicted transcriptional regulator